ncbi:MAG: glycoside hydrolase family 2 TIM barrel-domain containing protein [Mariniphaga sp.]
MRNLISGILFWLFILRSLVSYSQAKFPTDVYQFIENPGVIELNQEAGHAPLIPGHDLEKVFRNVKDVSQGYLSLNGLWKFNYAENPSVSPAGFFQPQFDDHTWGKINVPGNWEMQGYGDPMFRNVSQPFKVDPPRIPHDYNPVGSYRTTFVLPAEWQGKQVFLRMDGSSSATFVWLNGKEVGYNQGANEPAEYNLTPFLKPGKNSIAIQVYKYSDGTYLEDQDFWRLAGIFRDVYLMATPPVHIRDYFVTTDLDNHYKDADLVVKINLKNYLNSPQKNYRVRVTLYGKNHKAIQEPLITPVVSLNGEGEQVLTLSAKVKNPNKWSSEYPTLYPLTLELIPASGTPQEIIATKIGFKKVEVKHQALYLNGVAIKLNGVNSHMQHPTLGHTMDVETIRKDFTLMKQFNINCVRTSHYPPVQDYLELADELGIFIVDETGDESHATEFISERDEWTKSYVERVNKMVLRDRNHPCILFWSAGNESGFGKNICEVIKEGKRLDPTRLWMYGGNTDDVAWKNEVPCEEIIGPRYPTPDELETRIAQVPESQDPRPSFMDEYVAATGNGAGGLDEYWNLIYKYPRLSGGAIWDWMSPGITEKIRLLDDESPNQINTSIKGRGVLVEGKFGKAIELNGHDQWVETYQDPSLDITGSKLTLSFWVFPNNWNGNGTFLVKGDYQFGIVQKDEKNLEFYVTDQQKYRLSGSLPDNWIGEWHHVAGICDGENMSLYIDENKVANRPYKGLITSKPFPVSLGYSTENEGSEYSDKMSNARFDRVAIFDQAISVDRLLSADISTLKKESRLWLDFEREDCPGEYFSLGIGARSYGLVWPDRAPQAELWQVKKSAQPVHCEWKDANKGVIEITNRFAFTDLKELNCLWELHGDNKIVQQGDLKISLGAGERCELRIPFKKPELKPGVSYRLLLSFQTKEDKFYAKKGFEVAWDQLPLNWFIPVIAINKDVKDSLIVLDKLKETVISGPDFSYSFDKETGDLSSMKYGGLEILKKGPVLSVWRAPLVNETDPWANYGSRLKERQPGMGNGPVNNWFSLGLNHLRFKLDEFHCAKNSSGEVTVSVNNHAFGSTYHTAFSNHYLYTITPKGELKINHQVIPHGEMPAWLPRIGLKWVLNQSLQHIEWSGRGPFENYPDRKTGAKLGIYKCKLSDFSEPYLKPQDYGCRTDNQWVTFENGEGSGVTFSGDQLFNFSAQCYDTDHLTRAQYPYQLKPSDSITFNFDYATSGVGCTTISVLNQYRVLPGVYSFISVIQPFRRTE